MKTFVVIGLGRFGSAVATELSSLGHEVLAVDEREDHVQRVAEKVTHAVTGDARDPSVVLNLFHNTSTSAFYSSSYLPTPAGGLMCLTPKASTSRVTM